VQCNSLSYRKQQVIFLRRFVIVGTRAMAKGKLPLNDLAGGAGRMDVLIRALMSSILTSHGLRKDVEFTMILLGGPGPARRIKFVSNELKGIHAEERAVAGKVAAIIKEPIPPRGYWIERSPGIYDGGGNLDMTLDEWDCPTIRLEADSPNLYSGILPSNFVIEDVGFILGDDKTLECDRGVPRSLGSNWLQGHTCIAIVHFLLDEGVNLELEEN
jgi:tRNA pseudouridine-54 N-methylase